MNWLWIVLIIVGAAIACGLVFVVEKRKKIFKRHTKEEKKAKKEAKLAKKAAKNTPAMPPEPKKQEDEISFNEKQIEIIDDAKIESEEYTPSEDFVETDMTQYVGIPRRMTRRVVPTDYDETDYDDERQGLKEQLRSLSPEMKAVVFANLLDRKDDQF